MKQLRFTAAVLTAALSSLYATAQEATTIAVPTQNSSTAAQRAFNPAVSAIIDMFYYHENSKEGMSHVKEEMAGFGHSHGEDDHGHEHEHGYENGFNIRHLELAFSAEVDNYFKALAIAAVSEHGAEIHEAWGQTTGLPWGFQAKAGKIFSDFGYINKQHEHEWDFTDQPLAHELLLGSHGINELGVQATWLAPTPVYLLFGAEALQGENEKVFATAEAIDKDDWINQTPTSDPADMPENEGPRAGVGWVKFAPFQFDNSELQLGLSVASGSHQEAHPGEPDSAPGANDGENDHWLDGTTTTWGGDIVYKYNSGKAYGQGDLVLQAEYLFREKDMTVVAEIDRNTGDVESGDSEVAKKDGYYMQATYGILPRWRTGLRWEQVGLINEDVDGEYGDSWRATAMVDFRPSEFSQIRFQVNNGDYDRGDEGTENVWEAFVQLTFSIGAHGAHSF
jgi:hypothetical protein